MLSYTSSKMAVMILRGNIFLCHLFDIFIWCYLRSQFSVDSLKICGSRRYSTRKQKISKGASISSQLSLTSHSPIFLPWAIWYQLGSDVIKYHHFSVFCGLLMHFPFNRVFVSSFFRSICSYDWLHVRPSLIIEHISVVLFSYYFRWFFISCSFKCYNWFFSFNGSMV